MNTKTAASALRKRFSLRPTEQGFEAFVGNTPAGHLLTRPGRQTGETEVRHSQLEDRFRGLGLGRKLYGEAMRRLPEGKLNSGQSVSPEATGVWQKLMQNPSYDVTVNPVAQLVDREGKTYAQYDLQKHRRAHGDRAAGIFPNQVSQFDLPIFNGQITPKALIKEGAYRSGCDDALAKFAGASASPPANDGASAYRDSGSPVATTGFPNVPDEVRRAFAYNASLGPTSSMTDPGYFNHVLQGGTPTTKMRTDTTGGLE